MEAEMVQLLLAEVLSKPEGKGGSSTFRGKLLKL
jgi:hypothetical protein